MFNILSKEKARFGHALNHKLNEEHFDSRSSEQYWEFFLSFICGI